MFIMLFTTSIMFELHIVVVIYVMFNNLKLIIKIIPNYSAILGSNLKIMTTIFFSKILVNIRVFIH
jgi:hypothetical protein